MGNHGEGESCRDQRDSREYHEPHDYTVHARGDQNQEGHKEEEAHTQGDPGDCTKIHLACLAVLSS